MRRRVSDGMKVVVQKLLIKQREENQYINMHKFVINKKKFTENKIKWKRMNIFKPWGVYVESSTVGRFANFLIL